MLSHSSEYLRGLRDGISIGFDVGVRVGFEIGHSRGFISGYKTGYIDSFRKFPCKPVTRLLEHVQTDSYRSLLDDIRPIKLLEIEPLKVYEYKPPKINPCLFGLPEKKKKKDYWNDFKFPLDDYSRFIK